MKDNNGIHYDVIYQNSHEVNYYWDVPQFVLNFVRESGKAIDQYLGRHETLYFK